MVCSATGTLYVYTAVELAKVLARMFEIKTLIYTSVTPIFRWAEGKMKSNIHNLCKLSSSDPCRKQGASEPEGSLWLR